MRSFRSPPPGKIVENGEKRARDGDEDADLDDIDAPMLAMDRLLLRRRRPVHDSVIIQVIRALDHRPDADAGIRSEEHTSELQSRGQLVCRLPLHKTTFTVTASPGLPPARSRWPWPARPRTPSTSWPPPATAPRTQSPRRRCRNGP